MYVKLYLGAGGSGGNRHVPSIFLGWPGHGSRRVGYSFPTREVNLEMTLKPVWLCWRAKSGEGIATERCPRTVVDW